MVKLPQDLFGEGRPHSLAADKGYASRANNNILMETGVTEIGLQLRTSKDARAPPDLEQQKQLQNKRASIEPLMGTLNKEVKWD